MDYRLSNIADPDSRMATNLGTKENPKWESRIAKLAPEQIGYQKIKTLSMNGAKTDFKTDGTLLEVSLPHAIEDGATATFDLTWTAQVPEQIRRTGRNSKEDVALSMAQWYPKMAHFDEFGWHLDEYVAREFVAPFGNFDVSIHINKNYIVGASGVLQNADEVKGYQRKPKVKTQGNKATWHYKAENIHDFVWAADQSKAKRIVLRNNGIQTRYYALTKEGVPTHTNVLLTANAIRNLLDEDFKASDIQLISCGTSSPDYLMPSHAVMVHGELKNGQSEVNSASGNCCAGMNALKFGYLSVKAGNTDNAVCTGSERMSSWMLADHYNKEVENLKDLEEQPITRDLLD